MNYLGVDIGGTAIKIGMITDLGELLYYKEYSTTDDGYETPIIKTVISSIQDFLSTHTTEEIIGIGVSATGQIDVNLGTVIGVCGNIQNWERTPIKNLLEQTFSKPVTVVNDANCVALGEKWIGAAKDVSDVITITIGTGIGGGVIINHQIMLGSKGIAGEIGHFSIDREGKLCTCGNRGCFEQYGSMTALVKKVKQWYVITYGAQEDLTWINGKVIFDWAKKGNTEVKTLIKEWITDIAIGITGLIHIFNPKLILIGGGVCKEEKLFIEPLQYELKQKVMREFGVELQLKAATLGNNAGMIGAVYYLKKILEQ